MRTLLTLGAMLLALTGGVAQAEEDEPEPRSRPEVEAAIGGHLKSIGLLTFPYESVLLPEHPYGQALIDGRLNLSLDIDWFHAEAAHALTFELGAAPAATAGLFGTGVGASAPELLPLSWTAFGDSDALGLQGRTDRFLVRFTPRRVNITLGRQAIAFGNGQFFTPLDLVSPFTPSTIDTEYKPGVDAARLDVFFGFAGRVTAVAAYVGEQRLDERLEEDEEPQPAQERVAAAAYLQNTVGLTDIGGFYGFIRGDHVIGATVASVIGPVGIHGDVAVTIPRSDLEEEVFVRAVVGVMGRPGPTTDLSGEFYISSYGSRDSAELLEFFTRERVIRGEIWQSGIAYLSLNVAQEITPLLSARLGVVANLTEGSFLLLPGFSWSIADNAAAEFGGIIGLGRRPVDLPLDSGVFPPIEFRSEFGTWPALAFAQINAWF